MQIWYDFTEMFSKSVCVGSKYENVQCYCMIYDEAA